MDVILHVGAHRTATTTFQRAIARHGPALGAQGTEFWGPGRTRSGLFAGLIRRKEDVTDEIRRQGARSAGRIAIEMQRLAHRGIRRLLVSEENMAGAMPHMLSRASLYPDAEFRLARFAEVFGTSPTILLSVRDYRGWWPSVLAHAVAQGRPAPGPDLVERLVRQPRRWRHLVQDVARAFPGAVIDVTSFEGYGHRPGARLALLGSRTWPPGLGERPGQHNRSGDLAALRVALARAGHAPDSLVQKAPSAGALWQPFTPAQLDGLGASYLEDLRWLRNGADGLARFHEAPATDRRGPLRAAAGPRAGQTGEHRDDGTKEGLAQAGRG